MGAVPKLAQTKQFSCVNPLPDGQKWGLVCIRNIIWESNGVKRDGAYSVSVGKGMSTCWQKAEWKGAFTTTLLSSLYFLLVEQICSEDLLQSALRGKVSTKPSIHRFRSQRSMKQQKNVSEVTLDSSWPFVSCSTVGESHHQGWQLYTTTAPSSVPSFCLLSSGVTINVSPLSQQDMNF